MNFSKVSFDKHKKIWTTPRTQHVFNRECSMGRIIYNQLNCYPNVTLQIDDTTNVTLKARDVLRMAVRIAQHFHEMQLKQDDIIGFAVKNTTHVLPTVVGCFFNCTLFHPVNPSLDESTMAHCFGLTKPKLIFCDAEVYEKVCLATKSYKPKIIIMSGDVEGVVKITDFLEPTETERFYQPKHYNMGGRQTVAILCSSGSTGKPKAVCLTGSNFIYELPYITSESIVYIPSMIDWISGLRFLVISCISGCTRIITDKPFNADDFIILMKKYRITNSFIVPRYMATLVKHPQATKEDFSSLQIVQCSGSTVTEKLLRDFKALLNDSAIVMFCYGLTEFGIIAANMDASRITSVGNLLPNVNLRIVDDDGKNLGHNEVGEICVNNGRYWGGYYGNPIETQRVLDVHGWGHTGDLGYMDDDNYLYVLDRKKEIRKYMGLHFWPREIEEAIIEMPDINDACVVTVSNETKGDCSGALVVKKPNSSITEHDIIEYVKERLVAIHKQLHAGVLFVDQIPQNSNGKVVRMEAKKMFESMLGRYLIC